MRDTKRLLAILFTFVLVITLFSVVTSAKAKEDVNIYGQSAAQETINGEQVTLTTFQQPSQSAFAATQQFTSLDVCKCGSYSNKVFVTNTGNIYDFYTLQTQSNAQNNIATSIAPVSFELSPGETKEVLQYTTVSCGAEKTISETVTIQSRYNGKQSLQQTVQPKTCPNTGVSVTNPADTICPCTPTAYKALVVNTGAFTETYHLYIEGISEDYYRLSSYAITLLPGENKEVFAYVRQPCDVYGTFDFTLNTYAQASGLITKHSLRQNILQACYTYDLMLSELITFDPAKPTPTTALSFTPAADYTYQVCENTANMLLIKVRNPGEVINQYNLLLDAQPFMALAARAIALAPRQEQITQLFINPQTGDRGDYLFSIDANSARGDIHTVVPFGLQVRDCSVQESGAEEQDNLLLWLAALLGTLLLLFFILALLILLKKRRERLQISPKQTKRAESFNETKAGRFLTAAKNKFKENKLWRRLAAIIFILAALAFLFSWFAYPVLKENYQGYSNAAKTAYDNARISIPAEIQDAITKTKAFFPWYVDLMFLLLLLLLCLLPFFGKPVVAWLKKKYVQYKQKKQKKKDKQFKVTPLKKETLFDKAALRKAEQRKQRWKTFGKGLGLILAILLIVGLLGTGLYFGYQQYKGQQANQPVVEEIPEEKPVENKELTLLKDQLQEMQDQIRNLQSNIAQVNISQVDEDAKLRNTAEAVKEKTEQQEDQLNELKEQLEEKLREINSLIEQKSKELDDLNKQLAEQALKDAVGAESVEQKVEELDVQISAIETELDALDNDRLDTKNRLDQLNNRVSSLENNAIQTKERLDALEKIVQTILKRLDALESDFKEGKNPRTGDLINQTAAIKNELDETQQELSGGKEKIPSVSYDVPENFKTVLVLDISVSSLAVDSGVIRFDIIKEEARKYVVGNKVTLIVVGKNAVVVRKDITGDKAKRLVSYLKAGDVQTNIENSLIKAEQILDNHPGRIVVISDFIRTHGRDPYQVKKEIEAKGGEVIFVNVLDIIKQQQQSKQQTKPVFIAPEKSGSEMISNDEGQIKQEQQAVEVVPVIAEQSAEDIAQQSEEGSEKPISTSGEGIEPLSGEADTTDAGDITDIADATNVADAVDTVEASATVGQQLIIEVPTNGKLVVDLNKYFKDSDGDNLTFTVSSLENLDVLQKGSVLTFLPKKNFVGEEVVLFTADDGKAGVTSSPPVKVVVKDMPGQSTSIFTDVENIKKLLPLIITVIFVVFLYRAMKNAENDDKKGEGKEAEGMDKKEDQDKK